MSNVSQDDPPISFDRASQQIEQIISALDTAVIADQRFFESILTGALIRRHVLIEDVPGTGKTLTARSMATVLGLDFGRIQFTPDLLPSDITGSMVFDEQRSEFQLNRGPIFANVILADEINRAPPKTQAALLEAMEEKQVSIANETLSLPEPFFVLATQNPVEQEGTFALPEAQRDRFVIKTSLGYPARDAEATLIKRRLDRTKAAPTATQEISRDQFSTLQTMPEYVHVAPEIQDYVLDVGRATRNHPRVEVGVSPRGIQHFIEATRARAVIKGRDYAVPDDVKSLATPVLAHRLVLSSSARVDGVERSAVIDDILDEISVPAVNPA